MEVVLNFISGLIGAAVTGVPLWRQIKKIKAESAKDAQKLGNRQVEIDEKKAQADIDIGQQNIINKEAEWKRIIDRQDTELLRLRDRDDAQEKQLMDLFGRFIEAQKSEARKDEQIKQLAGQVERLTALLINRCPDCPYVHQLGVRNVGPPKPSSNSPSTDREGTPGVV